MRFQGCGTALVTPFRPDLSLDEEAFRALVRRQIEAGIHFLVPCGTTGENPTLETEEHHRVVEIALEEANGKLPVLAGCGGYHTGEVVALAREMEALGVDGLLSVTPYYNKPTQEGLFRHYMAIADAVEIPLFIYNIPGRSVIDMSVETMARLAAHKNIVGVKDATANLARPLHTLRACGPEFIQLSGEDHTALAYLAAGGRGCISVTANVAPKLCAQLHAAWARGDLKAAMAIQMRLLPLHDAMFIESNPGPVKYAASLLGFGTNTVRLPLAEVSAESAGRIKAAMLEVGLLA